MKSTLFNTVAVISLVAGSAMAQTPTTEAPAEGQLVVQSEAEQLQPRNYDETYGELYGDLGDRNVQELIGVSVASAEGNDVGEVDNFALVGNKIAAIVGIGGFLGMGEHEVALSLEDMTWDGEKLIVSGFTEDQLREMPEYDEASTSMMASDSTLRTGYEAPPVIASDETSTEMAAETETAEAETELEQAGDAVETEMAQAGNEVESEMSQAGDEVETEMAQAGNEVEQAGDEVEAEMAEAELEQTGDAAQTEMAQAETELEQAGDEVEAEVAEAGSETEQAVDNVTEDVAQAEAEAGVADGSQEQLAEATEMSATEAESTTGEPVMAEGDAAVETDVETDVAQDETAVETETADTQMAATETGGNWNEQMDTVFADIADRQVADLVGMEVAGADGELVGEIDNFALMGQDVVAIVGVGGFLGIGEHKVALSLSDMTYDGERLILSSLTEEQLEEMPEYDETAATVLPQDNTLRGSYTD